MATVTFAYNHARDPMNPDDLADKIAGALSLTSAPAVDINQTQIIVTHASITSGNTAAIQAVINAYVLDANRTAFPPGTLGTLLNKGRAVVSPGGVNATYLALGSPSTAANTAQIQALTRQQTAVIKALLIYISGQVQDTSGT